MAGKKFIYDPRGVIEDEFGISVWLEFNRGY